MKKKGKVAQFGGLLITGNDAIWAGKGVISQNVSIDVESPAWARAQMWEELHKQLELVLRGNQGGFSSGEPVTASPSCEKAPRTLGYKYVQSPKLSLSCTLTLKCHYSFPVS